MCNASAPSWSSCSFSTTRLNAVSVTAHKAVRKLSPEPRNPGTWLLQGLPYHLQGLYYHVKCTTNIGPVLVGSPSFKELCQRIPHMGGGPPLKTPSRGPEDSIPYCDDSCQLRQLSCSYSRPGKFTQHSGRWKKIHRVIGISDLPLFQGGEIHVHCSRTTGSQGSLIY